MKNLANFLMFQVGWFACVGLAVEGSMWLGSLAVLIVVLTHVIYFVKASERLYEVSYILVVGVVGLILDSALRAAGALHYPTSESVWTFAIVPPWIVSLWVLFAILPHHSLQWLRGRPILAVLLGAIGGPLSYWGGLRMGAVGVGEEPLWTWIGLSVEYAIMTPLLLHFAKPSAALAEGESANWSNKSLV